MIITQQLFGMCDTKEISFKIVKDERSGRYTTTINIELMDNTIQVISVSGATLDALVPTIEVCRLCNIELHEQELVAFGNSLPMASHDVDELPF